jgi:hypothetical protein
MNIKYVLSSFFLFLTLALYVKAADDSFDISSIPKGLGTLTSYVERVTKKIGEGRERQKFIDAVPGGHTIYLDEIENNKRKIAPVIVPYRIEVVKGSFKARNGKEEVSNTTRNAHSEFDGKLEHDVKAKPKHFLEDEYGKRFDPAPGQDKFLEILYQCMDHQGRVMSSEKRASAPEGDHIKLSCKDAPSYFAGSFKDK